MELLTITMQDLFQKATNRIGQECIDPLLLSQQEVTSKGIPVPYTNLQLNPYSNTLLDLFCSDNLFFQYTAPNT